MDPLSQLPVWMLLLVLLLLVLVTVLWICLPFAVFGMKPLLRRILRELERNNSLLSAGAGGGHTTSAQTYRADARDRDAYTVGSRTPGFRSPLPPT